MRSIFVVTPIRIPLQRSEAAEGASFHVQNHRQCVRVPVEADVKVINTETVAAAALPTSTLFFLAIIKILRKVENDRGIPL
jgi:hypothetical protein